jgi:hypothetical protein
MEKKKDRARIDIEEQKEEHTPLPLHLPTLLLST